MMMMDALPGIKRFLQPANLPPTSLDLVIRMVSAFILHVGRMSASQAAEVIRSQARHRANLTRFLAQCRWSHNWTECLYMATLLLETEGRRGGTWLFILDQTYCSQQGQKTENTFSRANYRPRQRKGQRKQKKHTRRSSHGFVMGLLLTPSGLRLPVFRSYYTQAYCQQRQQPYLRQTELAAQLVRTVQVPEGAAVVVLGDTAFDAKDIRAACAERDWPWIVPCNPERVMEQAKPRPKVSSLASGLTADQFAEVRFLPGRGSFAPQRRVARCRLGPKAKARTFYVHQERQVVHSVGAVTLLFSTKRKPVDGKPVEVQKILMSNDVRRSAAVLVELYDLRWQIELFFKECKSTLGFHQYRFRRFAAVERWAEMCMVTFLYLEWYRACQVRKRGRSVAEKEWWRWQRSHGLCVVLRQEAEDHDVERMARWSQTRTGLKKLKRCLHAARPLEYRKPAEKRSA